jgi:hypothetical protein
MSEYGSATYRIACRAPASTNQTAPAPSEHSACGDSSPGVAIPLWGERCQMIADSWRDRWEHIIPFLALPAELRRAGLHHQQHRQPQPAD